MKNDGMKYPGDRGVGSPGRLEEMAAAEWCAHPAFIGVSLKCIVSGGDTGQRFSTHLVRVEPQCALAEHRHDGRWELHEVLAGEGCCRLASEQLVYQPGRMAVIPQDTVHSVTAGDAGLTLMATFFPALG